jgi:hypothetical protein
MHLSNTLGSKYRVSIKSFPDYENLLQENYVEYKYIFFKYNSTQEVFFTTNLNNGKKIWCFSDRAS